MHGQAGEPGFLTLLSPDGFYKHTENGVSFLQMPMMLMFTTNHIQL